ncbi:MAG TPA: hypothetical protein ENN12_02690 [Epsilonproteobacteria bacterium]|mgnify:CR=1 FL=1|nr:hypothetical protein [Campylobacterota bacterium]
MVILFLFVGIIFELFASIKFITILGFWGSLVWIFATAFAGLMLLKYTHYKMLYGIKDVFGSVRLHRFYQNSMGYVFASALLILPGVVSDALGCVALAFVIYLQFVAKIKPISNLKGEKDVIDVEIIEDTSTEHHRS